MSSSFGAVNVNHGNLVKNSCSFGNNQKIFVKVVEVMGFSLPL